MALEIMIVKDASIPYWEQDGAIVWGEVDPAEFGSLFRKDLDVKSVFEYTAEGGDMQAYEDYYSKRISLLKEKFPLIVRINDYYEDALFSRNEIHALIEEVLSLKEVVKREESRSVLNQLLEASETALKYESGIILVAD